MTLATGTRLGRYEIRSKLGAGGMGEVYLAHDPKINRNVAIKVLPAAFSSDAERLRRFEQEVQATGKLNHPNILGVYDVETHDGAPYVVYELLEGDTLRDRLKAGALSARKAVDYALQIANGVAVAHAKGVVHRDLKPDNIFIANDGHVKILDFGLAKLNEPIHNLAEQTDVSTRKVNTDPGAVMGTVGYMSPEQVRGQRVDHRSDIFSLGVILYEMLSGKRAFRGDSAVETLNAILKEDPPELSQSNSQINPALERVVMHCLEKSPEQRFQSAQDVAFALDSLSGLSSGRTITADLPLTTTPGKKRDRLPWILAVAFLIGLLAALPFAISYFRQTREEAPAARRFFIYPPEETSFSGPFAVSPDGRSLVLRGISEGKVRLWVRPLDSLTAQSLDGTEDAVYPFWSADSRFIGFFSAGKLKKVEATGGPTQTLCDAPDPRGGTWNHEGVIVFAPKPTDALYRVSAAGGTPIPVTMLDASRKEVSHYHPRFLPDGRHFLYLANSSQPATSGIYVGSLDLKETKLLFNARASTAYASGYLLFLRDGSLMAQSFNPETLELTGEPSLVAEKVDRLGGGGHFGVFSVSETGVLVYRSGESGNTQLNWFGRDGKPLGSVGPTAAYTSPWLSPDEKRVAVGRIQPEDGRSDIWLIELARATLTRFTFEPGSNHPVWSPDASRILFSMSRGGAPNIYQKAASGAGKDEALLKSDNRLLPNDWSADGQFILYQSQDTKTSWDLWVLPLSGEQKPRTVLQTQYDEVHGRFSPDGKWIAYTSNESGSMQVYVQRFPASGGKWQISTNGGAQPQWRRDGKELFYLSPNRKLMAVEVKGDGSTFEAGIPKDLFEVRLRPEGLPRGRNEYVVTADGQRFLVVTAAEEWATTPTAVVLNWTADLKR